MWRLALLFLALYIVSGLPAGAQDCTPDTIILGSQAEVDSFQADHGPCDSVVGGLVISGSDIVDLGGLSGLTSIGASFSVQSNAALPSVDLPALAAIGGDLRVVANAALTSLELDSLTGVDGGISMFDNGLLTELVMPELVDVSGGFFVGNHPALSLVDLPRLERVGNNPLQARALYFESNPSLETLNLPRVREVGFFRVEGSTSLMSLEVPDLDRVRVDLRVADNEQLRSVSMPAVTFVGSGIAVAGNSSLSSCCGILPLLRPGVVQQFIYISGNAPGCSSPSEIEAFCAVQIPTVSPWGLALLAILLAAAGVVVSRSRLRGADPDGGAAPDSAP